MVMKRFKAIRDYLLFILILSGLLITGCGGGGGETGHWFAAAEPKIIVLVFEDVHFDFDKSTLSPEAQTILKRNVKLLIDNPKAKIRVAGYTSASGTEEYNQKLSERRARAVQEYLISEGVITRDRLSTIGYGETRPEVYEAAPKQLYLPAAKANMRVLFEIVVQ
jgi:outer membrane protein OmpA-like peptidoglycan-associated protein